MWGAQVRMTLVWICGDAPTSKFREVNPLICQVDSTETATDLDVVGTGLRRVRSGRLLRARVIKRALVSSHKQEMYFKDRMESNSHSSKAGILEESRAPSHSYHDIGTSIYITSGG